MKTLDLCFPPMEPQVNNMHSKLMLFFHHGYLRIAVPTANLTRTDWGEDGLMENASQPLPPPPPILSRFHLLMRMPRLSF